MSAELLVFQPVPQPRRKVRVGQNDLPPAVALLYDLLTEIAGTRAMRLFAEAGNTLRQITAGHPGFTFYWRGYKIVLGHRRFEVVVTESAKLVDRRTLARFRTAVRRKQRGIPSPSATVRFSDKYGVLTVQERTS